MDMKKLMLLILGVSLASCSVSNKTLKRMQIIETGVRSPSTVEELKDGIAKYDKRIRDLQMSESQVGIWYKILGTRYVDMKMYTKALEAFQKALEYYPDNQNIYYYVGVCAAYSAKAALDFNATGENGKRAAYLSLSEDAYLRALSIEEGYAKALYGIGVLYVFELKKFKEAIPYLKRLLEKESRNFNGMFVLAGAYYGAGEVEEAVSVYDKIISMAKDENVKNSAENLKRQVLNGSFK